MASESFTYALLLIIDLLLLLIIDFHPPKFKRFLVDCLSLTIRGSLSISNSCYTVQCTHEYVKKCLVELRYRLRPVQ